MPAGGGGAFSRTLGGKPDRTRSARRMSHPTVQEQSRQGGDLGQEPRDVDLADTHLLTDQS